MKTMIRLIPVLAGLAALVFSCKQAPLLPDEKTASKLIQDLILENGQMPGGNQIDIHRFQITQRKPAPTPNQVQIEFEIDFTRYPTSGLAPEYQTDEPRQQTEKHQAVLRLEKDTWSVQDLSLH